MDQVQYQQAAVYSQPADVGVFGRVSYNDHMHAAFTVPANSGGRVPPIMPPTSGSIPAGGPAAAQSPARGFRGTPDNAKTKMCMRWMAGDCRFGDRCNFAHGDGELRQLPRRDNVMQPFSRPYNGQFSDQYGRPGAPFGRMNSYPSQMMVGQSGAMMVGGQQTGYGRQPVRAHSVDTATGTQQFQAVQSHNSGSTTPPYSPTNTNNPQAMPTDMSREAWVASGCPVPGQNNWWKYTSQDGEDYYHNYRTGVTQWELPVDFSTQTTPTTPHTAVSTPFKS